MPSFRPLALSILALVFVALPAAAQVADPVTTAEAPVPGAGHDYIGMPTETVNPADGSLSFHLTIKTPSGRELSFPFGVGYHSTDSDYLINYSNDTTLSWHPRPGTGWESYGWSYDLPTLAVATEINYVQPVYSQLGQLEGYNQCDASLDYTFRGLDGKQYTFGLGAQWTDTDSYQWNGCTDYQTPTSSIHSVSAQFTGGTWSQWPLQPPVTVTDQSGTIYQFPGTGFGTLNPSGPFPVQASIAQTITDRNGNQMVLNSNGNGYIDTLGRQVVSWSADPGTAANLTVAGYSNPYQLSYATVSSSYSVSIQNVGGTTCTGGTSVGGTYNGINQIVLPNGKAYTFTYDPTYGYISKITFPGGGYVSYTWGLNLKAAGLMFQWANQASAGNCSVRVDTPAITDRYVNDGTTTILHQHFTYTTTWGSGILWTSKTTTVTTTDLVTNTTTITKYTFSPMTPDKGGSYDKVSQSIQVPVETQILYEDGSSNVLKTVNKAWTNIYSLAAEQTILDNGQGTAKLYCGDNNIITDLYEYGFQSEGSFPGAPSCVSSIAGLNTSEMGPLRRHTATAYHNFASTHIDDEPDSVTVYDGSGTEVSQTSFTYDASSVSASGAQTGLVSPPGARGNLSTVTHWLSGGTSPVTSYTYYDTGQVYQVTDACGNTTCSDMSGTNHTTTYSYSDNYASGTGTPPGQTFAYLTQVTLPNTGVAHVESFSWGYNDGLVRTSTDQNSHTTSYGGWPTLSTPVLTLAGGGSFRTAGQSRR